MGIFTNEKIDESLISVAVNKDEKQLIRNVYCHNLDTEDMKKVFCDIMSDDTDSVCKAVMFLNINAFYIAQKSNPYCRALNKADYMLNDGVGIGKLARTYGVEFKENMNGTDLIPKMIRWMADIHGEMDFEENPDDEGGIYLLGAVEHNVNDAARNLNAQYGKGFVRGYHHGFIYDKNPDPKADYVHLKLLKPEYAESIVEDINRSKASMVVLGMGMPLQENWIETQMKKLTHAKIVVAGGAIIDYVSGNIKRCPQFFIKMKLEWLYRLLHNPKRLWKRNAKGFMALLKYRKHGK